MQEVKKLRKLQIALVTQTKKGHLLLFGIIAFVIKSIVMVGVIFTLQGIESHYQHYFQVKGNNCKGHARSDLPAIFLHWHEFSSTHYSN